MPRPRFHKLPLERQRALLDAAGRHFAQHGYQRASFNLILGEVGVSKGAAYYTFDDKLDLYATVVEDAWQGVAADFQVRLAGLDRDSFWPAVQALYTRQLQAFGQRPWAWRAVKGVRQVLVDPVDGPRLHQRLAPMLALLQRLGERAVALGLVRTDLPLDLVVALLGAADDAVDSYVLDHPDAVADPAVLATAFGVLRTLVEGPRG